MVIKKESFYGFLFAIVIFAQLYVESFRINTVLQISTLSIYFYFEKFVLPIRLIKNLLPVVILFFIGFAGFFFHDYSTFNFVKDIFHFIKPILGISIGYLFFSKSQNIAVFIKTIIFVSLFSAIIHLIVLLTTGSIFTGSVEAIRSLSRDNFLELFAIFFLIYFRKFEGYLLFEKKIIHRLILGLLLLSCILYFSRTMLIVAFILYASVNGYSRLTVKSIKIIGVFLLCVGLMYAYLFSIKIDRRAEGLENFLFKIKNAPEELFVTKINRNDHKDLWDHWRGYEAKRALELMKKQPSSYVVGTGQGSLVNLKFKAPLTSDGSKGLKYISELHNGYIYIFYKTGIIGLVILLSFLFSIYNTINKKEWKNKMDAVFISAIGIIFLFSTLTITGIYNSRDIIIFILGALLFFLHKENVDLKIKDEAN